MEYIFYLLSFISFGMFVFTLITIKYLDPLYALGVLVFYLLARVIKIERKLDD